MRGLIRRTSAVACVALGAFTPAAEAARSSLPAVPSGARPGPDVLYADAPSAPQLENTGPWRAPPILVSGATAYRDGEFLYQDFLFDDHGAAGSQDPSDPFNDVENMFSPKRGTLTYPTDPVYGHNAADLVELRVKPLADAVALRVTLNTMKDAERVGVTVAIGGSDVPRPWPHGAGVASPAAMFLTVHGSKAELLDAASGKAVSPAPTAAVDMARRQIDVRIPHAAWNPGTSVARLAAGVGLWDPAAGGYLTPGPVATATTPGGVSQSRAALFNMAFRTDEPLPVIYEPGVANTIVEGHAGVKMDGAWWRERKQGDVLATGDVTPFAANVDFGKLARRVADDGGVPKSGHIDRIFASRFVFGQGIDYDVKCFTSGEPECTGRYVGQLQPYALYIPAKPAPAAGYGLVVSMHGLSANHNEFLGSRMAQQFGDRGTGSIFASPEGRGPDGFYESQAEIDVFEMWADVARHYPLDPTLANITGYSMGGAGTYRLATRWPDLFARAFPIVGPPSSTESFESLHNVPVMAWYAQTDELVGPEMSEEAFLNAQQAGIRYDHWTFTPAGHITLGNNDEFGPAVEFFGDHRVDRDPAQVTYSVDPSLNPKAQSPADHAYWVSGLTTRESGTGLIEARSAGFGIGEPTVKPLAVSGGSLEGGSHGPLPYHRRTFDWEPVPAAAKANRVEVTATNIATATIDAPRARVGCDAEIKITTDGPTKVGLAGCDVTTKVKKGTTRVRCLRKRSLKVRVPKRLRDRRVRSARIAVNGRRARTVRRPRLVTRVSFKGLKSRRVKVRIVARLAGGRKVTTVRTYKLCKRKARRPNGTRARGSETARSR